MPAPRRAVIGSGIAGLAAAHVLSTRGPVTLYEADARLGGHADTHEVEVGGRTIGIANRRELFGTGWAGASSFPTSSRQSVVPKRTRRAASLFCFGVTAPS